MGLQGQEQPNVPEISERIEQIHESHRRRAVVTGCAGFLGSHLSERLIAEGFEVVGVDRFSDSYPRSLKERNLDHLRAEPDFTLREIDLGCDPLEGLLEGADTVYHLAARPGVRASFGDKFGLYLRDNVRATQRLLEEAVGHTLSAFVYASSSSVYGDTDSYPTAETATLRPVSPYGATKLAVELLAGVYYKNKGVPAIGMRYFTAYGPRQRPDMAFYGFFERALAGIPISILGDGRQIRDFTYVDDIIDGTLAAGERGTAGSVYNIGNGSPTELLKAVKLVGQIIERPIEVQYNPPARGDARQTAADISKAEAELDFAPKTTLTQGLSHQLEWMLEHVRTPSLKAEQLIVSRP